MLPAPYRISRRSDISETIRRGVRARRGALVVHLLLDPESPHSPAQAAFAVGKTVGNSVRRHEVVRRLRALMPPLLDQLPPGSRVVVRALPEAASTSSQDLKRDLESALARAQRTDDVPTPSAPSIVVVADAQVDPVPPNDRSGLARIGWILGTPFRWLLIGLVWGYRHTISPILPPTCRYHPSCSAYAFQALQVHGAAKGFALAVWRVLRCNPFTPGGLDPVPTHGHWRPDILPDGRPRTPAHAAGGPA